MPSAEPAVTGSPIAAAARQVQSLLAENRLAEAEPPLRRLALFFPGRGDLLRLLGAVTLGMEDFEASARHHRRGLCAAPGDPALLRSGLQLPPEAGWPDHAVRRLLVTDPDVARGYAILAARGERFGHCLAQALALSPLESQYLSLAAARRNEAGDAGRASWLARRALAADPGNADGLLVLAEMQRSLDRAGVALGLVRRALAAAPSHPAALVTAAVVQHRLSLDADAARSIAAAATRDPRNAGYAARAATLIPHIVGSWDEIAAIRRRIEELVERDDLDAIADPIREVGTVPFALAYHGVNDRALLQRLCAFYRRLCPALSHVAPHVGRRPAAGRRRVAFVSEFFRQHSVFNMTEGHLRRLDRDVLEVIVVQIGPLPDVQRAAIGRHVDRVVVLPADLNAVRAALSDMALDAVVFADIGMTPMSYFLAFGRYAPLQVVLPGHPVTTGIDTVDVFFTSDWMEPRDCADHYSETPHRVDGLAVSYAAERIERDPVNREDFGLPAHGRIYLCGQMPFKIHPDFDLLLGDLLEQDGSATVMLFEAPGGLKAMQQPLLDRIRRSNAGRHRALDRLRILPRLPLRRYIGLMSLADVVLDTTHFSGGNTTMQSLALGRPLVALPTAMMRGRVAAAPLRQMGLENEFLAASAEDYVDRAVALARDDDRARDLRRRLLERAPDLLETTEAAASLNALLLGGPPTG